MIESLKTPLIALALSILPFFVFLGSTSERTVNGTIVASSWINIGALVAIPVVLFMTFGYWQRNAADRSPLGWAVLLAALAVCALHVTDVMGVTAIRSLS